MQNQDESTGVVLEESIVQGTSLGFKQEPIYFSNNYPLSKQQLKLDQQIIFQGTIFNLAFDLWHQKEGILTYAKFMEKYDLKNINKVKLYKDSKPQLANTHMIKITISDKDYVFAAANDSHGQWFTRIIWAKLVGIRLPCDIEEQFINVCCGDVLKKGQFFGSWEQRYVMITPKDGLMSYRNRKASPTLTIQSAKQIWTRFQFINGNSFFVVKIKNLLIKEQFAIPTNNVVKWLRAFYSLLK